MLPSQLTEVKINELFDLVKRRLAAGVPASTPTPSPCVSQQQTQTVVCPPSPMYTSASPTYGAPITSSPMYGASSPSFPYSPHADVAAPGSPVYTPYSPTYASYSPSNAVVTQSPSYVNYSLSTSNGPSLPPYAHTVAQYNPPPPPPSLKWPDHIRSTPVHKTIVLQRSFTSRPPVQQRMIVSVRTQANGPSPHIHPDRQRIVQHAQEQPRIIDNPIQTQKPRQFMMLQQIKLQPLPPPPIDDLNVLFQSEASANSKRQRTSTSISFASFVNHRPNSWVKQKKKGI